MDRTTCSVAAWLLLAAACGGGGSTPAPVDRNVEPMVTIAVGVYGQITQYDDVGLHQPEYLPGLSVSAYDVPTGAPRGAAIAGSTSEPSRGFYELALPAGDHLLCTSFDRCVAFTVPAGQRVRLDYEMGPGPGWSAGTAWP